MKGVYKEKQNTDDAKKKRKRDIIWFNPPYNSEVSTNIGRKFLELIDYHFPKNHKLRSCINRNCIKVSYSCTKNMRNIIQSHNKTLLKKYKTDQEEKREEKITCNCRPREACPLDGHCQESIVYKAEVNNRQGQKVIYIGSSNDFKKRYANHKKSFRYERYKCDTALSKYIWENDLSPNPNITWTIMARAHEYKAGQRYCDLCLTEKYYISQETKQSRNCINTRSDLTNRCVHKTKFKLNRVK